MTMKVWLASLSVLFALDPARLGAVALRQADTRAAPAWLGPVHRMSGRLAFLVSLPVAYHCLYQLAFQDSTTRVLRTRSSAARSTARSRSRSSSCARPSCPGSRCRSPAGRCSACSSRRGSRAGCGSSPRTASRPRSMLAGLDRVLAVVTWVAAALVVVALFAGPSLIGAEKEDAAATAAPAGEPAAAPARRSSPPRARAATRSRPPTPRARSGRTSTSASPMRLGSRRS